MCCLRINGEQRMHALRQHWAGWLMLFMVQAWAGEPAPPAGPASTNLPALQRVGDGLFALGQVRLDKNQSTVSFPAVMNMNAGAIEYALVGSNGKIHESLLRTDVEPLQVHTAMLLLGAKDTTPRLAPGQVPPGPRGDEILIWFEWDKQGRRERVRIEDCIRNTESGKIMTRGPWVYNGSRLVNGQFLAQTLLSFVAVMEDSDALVNNPRPGHENDKIWVAEAKPAPEPGTLVTVIFELSKKPAREGTPPGAVKDPAGFGGK